MNCYICGSDDTKGKWLCQECEEAPRKDEDMKKRSLYYNMVYSQYEQANAIATKLDGLFFKQHGTRKSTK